MLPGIYTSRDVIDVDETSKRGIQLKYDDIIMETKLLETSKIIGFNDKSCFTTQIGFNPYWDYKPNYEHFNQKITKIRTI